MKEMVRDRGTICERLKTHLILRVWPPLRCNALHDADSLNHEFDDGSGIFHRLHHSDVRRVQCVQGVDGRLK